MHQLALKLIQFLKIIIPLEQNRHRFHLLYSPLKQLLNRIGNGPAVGIDDQVGFNLFMTGHVNVGHMLNRILPKGNRKQVI